MHGASLQCSQDGGCTTDSFHLQGPFWWGVHLPWLSGVLDSVSQSFPSKTRYMCLAILKMVAKVLKGLIRLIQVIMPMV